MRYLALILPILISVNSFAQEGLKYKISAYVDSYIATDDDKNIKPWDSENGTKYRKFGSVGYLKDEFAINLAEVGADFTYNDYSRGSIFIQSGTLAEYAYGTKSPTLQQAWAGFNVFSDLWIDAGLFFTHIGLEGYKPKDNFLSSHSLVTLFEPFYHQGVRVNWEAENFIVGLHILNGNNLIEDNNDNKSLGSYLSYSISDNFTVSYAGIYGNEAVGSPSNSQFHVFHNLNIVLSPTDKLSLKAQFDFSNLEDGYIEENDDTTAASYMGFSGQARYQINEKFAASVRFSFVNNSMNAYLLTDKGFAENSQYGFDAMAITGGIEYTPVENGYIRFEARMLNINEGEEKLNYPGRIFYDGEETISSRIEAILNFGIWI